MKVHLIKLSNYSIFEMLQLEEALLRADDRNWCLINDGARDPAVVMGISGKAEEHVKKGIEVPIIKRFSGGGTVVVDQDTCFISFIMGGSRFNPDKIFCWSDEFYRGVFQGTDYRLVERDYTWNNRKFGGNAQYIRKDRWLHHSTLLWDYESELMNMLHLPQRRPEYRESRDHENFLCCLKDFVKSRETFWKNIEQTLHHSFTVSEVSLDSILAIKEHPHRKATALIS